MYWKYRLGISNLKTPNPQCFEDCWRLSWYSTWKVPQEKILLRVQRYGLNEVTPRSWVHLNTDPQYVAMGVEVIGGWPCCRKCVRGWDLRFQKSCALSLISCVWSRCELPAAASAINCLLPLLCCHELWPSGPIHSKQTLSSIIFLCYGVLSGQWESN